MTYAFEKMLPHIITTFHMPSLHNPSANAMMSKTKAWKDILGMPFPCIRIIHKQYYDDHPNGGVVETICHRFMDGDSPAFAWTAKVYREGDSGRHAKYSPEEDQERVNHRNGAGEDSIPYIFTVLMDALSNRTKRYVEKPVTRQVRRSEGIESHEYREYIVVNKDEVPIGKQGMRFAEIARRHPQLHAVRGHMRHISSGRIVPVRPHTRGTGILAQAKEYEIRLDKAKTM